LDKFLHEYSVAPFIQRKFFTAYSDFVEILNEQTSRQALRELRATDSRTDPTFAKVKEISLRFEQSLDHIFFENELIKPLTRKYGVF